MRAIYLNYLEKCLGRHKATRKNYDKAKNLMKFDKNM